MNYADFQFLKFENKPNGVLNASLTRRKNRSNAFDATGEYPNRKTKS